jgi:hypothetical protein
MIRWWLHDKHLGHRYQLGYSDTVPVAWFFVCRCGAWWRTEKRERLAATLTRRDVYERYRGPQ